MRFLRTALLAAACAAAAPAWAANAVRGARLYLQTDSGVASCFSCHGPDPGRNRNNILNAADRPSTLDIAIGRVSRMGFLGSELSTADREDVAAFLGTVARLNDTTAPVRAWPITFDFGNLPGAGTRQRLRISNPTSQPLALGRAVSADPAALEVGGDCPGTLAAGASCDLDLRVLAVPGGRLRSAVQFQVAGLATPVTAGVLAVAGPGPATALAWTGDPPSLQLQASSPAAVVQSLQLTNPGPMPALLEPPVVNGPGAPQFRLGGTCTGGRILQAGTACDVTVTFTPDAREQVEATLQLRSDQANPSSVLLQGIALPSVAPASAEAVVAAGDSGGGCSVGPPRSQRTDPLLALLLAAALLARLRGRGRRR